MVEYYKNLIDEYIPNSIIKDYKNDIIRTSCLYVLQNGKRIRPIIVLSLINDNNNIDAYLDCALTIEFIHNASLIIDDLPSMDNDDYRRGELTLHKKTNESIAQMCAMSLIGSSFKSVYIGMNKLSKVMNEEEYKEMSDIFIKELINIISEDGIIEGQLNDILIRSSEDRNSKKLKSIMDKKTGI